MHLSRLIKTSEFTFSVDGRAATFDDLFPGFERSDRVGVVSRTPGSAHRAAGLLLATVGRFYELHLAESDDFYAYPNFYVFHVDELRGYHGMLDVWPEHKEVVTAADPESIAHAINDRGVTRLLVEDAPSSEGTMARETVEELRERLRTAYAFSPADRTRDTDDVVVTPSAPAITAIGQSAERSRAIVGDALTARLADEAGEPQSFRRIDADAVLSVLCGYGRSDAHLTFSEQYRRATGLTEEVLDRHRYAV